ncbi:unnamed protein product [Didymodactylos carnosus]|uniref:NAD(P)(+)--arginine ADP-ribosyltransferase n=1 Tax=Didymodactylos carnosus TaxID=1234261 RepID=A0A814CL76_9BILA|nr:unnamed protein product [Didymodactylos carnosus]CAF1313027.1 unnamed protein product [Didymodactylos carnosus]CAF3721108.1 unnamed protein product [Didymodactylos carnosus]CAF4121301.1 unnamed protein product [Didymodactylos carnosus]
MGLRNTKEKNQNLEKSLQTEIAAASSSLTLADQDDDNDEKNFETFLLIWLDANVNPTDDNFVQQKLHLAINYIKVFDSVEQCEQFILKRNENYEKIVLVVSESYARQVVPDVHDLPQISAIYVYGIDKSTNANWAKQYKKAVISNFDELVKIITEDQIKREKFEDSLMMPMTILDSTQQQKSLSTISGNFMFIQLFIEILLRMEYVPLDRQELIKTCQQVQAHNNYEIKIINEFQFNYSSDKALWWYTRETCLYRMLNKALRIQDIDMIFTFRFFIADLYKQLKQIHKKQQNDSSRITKVYRGQKMSVVELQTIQKSINQHISMNSFLSTTLNSKRAISFIPTLSTLKDDKLQSVLFEIIIDSNVTNTKPFGSISDQSFFSTEEEVLFMIGTIFIIEDVEKNDKYWTIRLRLADETDHQLRDIFDYMKTNIKPKTNLLSLGILLCEMGEYSKAKTHYQHLLDKLPKDDNSNRAHCFQGLGCAYFESGNFDLSIVNHQTAIEIFLLIPNNEATIVSYHGIGHAYLRKGDYQKASEYFDKSLEVTKTCSSDENSLAMAITYNNLGLLYTEQNKYNDALSYYSKALAIYQKNLPDDHYEIGMMYCNIGYIYYKQQEYNLALFYYEKELTISLKTFPSTHPDIGNTYLNIGSVYEDLGRYETALCYFNKADIIFREAQLVSTHAYVVELQKHIQSLNAKLNK